MKTLKQEIFQAAKIIILALFIAVGTGYIFADWSAPTSTPPTCVAGTPGCDAPLNVGYGGQVKQGNLDIKGLINSTTSTVNGLIVENGNVGIGTIAPAQKLDVTGQIHATGDICTDAGGTTKCLSTVGGSAGVSVVVKGTATWTITSISNVGCCGTLTGDAVCNYGCLQSHGTPVSCGAGDIMTTPLIVDTGQSDGTHGNWLNGSAKCINFQ